MKNVSLTLPALLILSALAPATAQAANVVCGQTLNAVSIVLDGDVGPCPGTGVVVTNGAVLDLNGFQVSCDGSMLSVGINVLNGSTLKNGIVTGCGFSGVQVTGTEGSTIESVNSKYNSGAGFNVYSAEASTLRYNTALFNDLDGYFVATGPHKFASNSASDNGDDGFVTSADGAYFSGNQSMGNTGDGFEINSTGAKFKANTANRNTSMGFRIVGTGNSLGSSVAVSNSWGVYLLGNENQLNKSLITSNVQFGIRLEGGDGNTISGSRVHGNEAAGISVSGDAEDNVLKKNRAFGNRTEDDLISAEFDCGTNDWSGNEGSTAEPCTQQ